MRIRPVLSGLTLALALSHQSAFALDLLEAYQKAQKNDPTWSAATNNYRADKETLSLGTAYLLPSIDLSGSISENEREPDAGAGSDYRSTQWQARATQPLFRLDAWYGYQQARSQSSQADANYRQTEQDLVLRVAQAYFSVLSAQEILEYSKAEETALGRQMDQAQQRFDVGLIAITDVLEAQAQHDASRAGRIAAEANLNTAREQLAIITGEYETTLAPLRSDVNMTRPVPENPEDWVKLAREKNPQLISAKYAADSASSATKVNRAGYLPQVNLFAQYSDTDLSNTSNPQINFNSGTNTSYGLEATWNVFGGGRTTAQTRQASYREAAARDQVTSAERNAVSGTRTAFSNVAANSYQVEARKQAVASSASAMDATQAGYEVGTRNIVDVLLAQRTLYAAKRDYATARYDYVINSLKLKAAAGQLTELDIKELNNWLDPNASITASPEVTKPDSVVAPETKKSGKKK